MSGIIQDIVSKALAYANAEKHETCLMNTITVLGAAALVYLTIKVACNVLSCLSSALPSKKYWKKGDWALITGATDVGALFAYSLFHYCPCSNFFVYSIGYWFGIC